jgi:hypothetical protein
MLTHVVVMQFESPDDATSARDRLLGMKGRIGALRDIEAGVDVLRSERSWELALITRFDSLEDLQIYAVHPAHTEVLAFIKPRLKRAVTVDFESP